MQKPVPAVYLLFLMVPWLEAGSPPSVGWTTYNGSPSGNRLSSLGLINTNNVASLRLIYRFNIPNPSPLEVTPLVNGNTMYITSVNSVYTFNLTNGKPGWSFVRPQTPGVAQDAGNGFNRGAALGTNGVYLSTDNAHLLTLNPNTGALQWETVMADYTQNYGTTAAPLYLSGPNLVISGISGGDSGVRGFLAAYDANTGNQVWQVYTTPSGPSDPLAASWGDGLILPHGCGATWTTGTYDATTNMLYWGVGNPCPDYDGDNRQGDDLYTSSVLAMNASTGAIQWYFQFTPHNLWDHDGTSTPILVDANWQGQPRHLLMQANRNGYFYVLDRVTGQFLAGYPFVDNLTWATGLNASGAPVMNPATVPTTTGALSCPSSVGANSFQSTAYSTASGLFYVEALESCAAFYKELQPAAWLPGQNYGGGISSGAVALPPQKHLRAINPASGAIVWDYAQQGYANSFGGVLATAGGLVFFGDDNGSFSAANAATGALLWSYEDLGTKGMKSSPMTFEVSGRQYVAIAFTSSVAVFGLPASPGMPVESCPANAAQVGASYSSTVAAHGGTPPYTYAIASGSLPRGLSLDTGTGAISGTPAAGGVQTFAAQVVDSVGHKAPAYCAITVTPLPIRFGCALEHNEVGAASMAPFAVAGGVPPYTFSITSGMLPPGLALDSSYGVVIGTPTTSGSYSYTAQVTDSSGTPAGTASASCILRVVQQIHLGCAANSGAVGTPYSSSLPVTGGETPFTYSITGGTLPPGLTLDSATGAITGTPTMSGSYSYTAAVADNTGLPAGTATANCGITIAP